LPLLSYLELGALRPRDVDNPEDFVTVALREALASAYGGRVDDQNQNYFDEARQVRLRPDIVWKIRGVSGRCHRRQVQSRKATRIPER
jgi:hypothetical protein